MINIEKLRFAYKKESLLQNVNLNLEPGNIYGLLGSNGVGKSTLLKLIAGLLFPNEGSIEALGTEPFNRSTNFLSNIFLLTENAVAPNMTGKAYYSVTAPFYPKFDHKQFERCISKLDIPLNLKLNSLSHGQQKKFFLAFGLSCRTQLLLLDEPTNGLDIPSKSLFKSLIAESFLDDQIIIISTHQAHDIESLIDAIIILQNGQITFNQTLEELSEIMHMTVTSTAPDKGKNLIYSEPALGGFANLWHGKSTTENQIDLELLFKALNKKTNSQKSLLSQGL